MKTKIVHKNEKKRSLSESFVSPKDEKEGNVNEPSKNPKRIKFSGSKQNGNLTLEKKVPISRMDKQRKQREQSKMIKQQNNIVKPSEIKKDTKEEAKLIKLVKPEKEIVNKTRRLKSKSRNVSNYIANLTMEQITKKIEEIKSRDVLSKRAKRLLGALNKKLKECVNETEKLDEVGKKSNKKVEYCTNALMRNKQKVNEDKIKAGKKHVQSKGKLQEEDDSDIDEDESDIEDESDENEIENELADNKKKEIDDESDEDEEDEEEIEDEEDEEEIEDEEVEDEEEEEVEDEEDIEDEDNEEDEEDEEDEKDEKDEEDIIKKAKISEVRKKVQNKNKQGSHSLANQKKGEIKKKRYVLFVGNLPRK